AKLAPRLEHRPRHPTEHCNQDGEVILEHVEHVVVADLECDHVLDGDEMLPCGVLGHGCHAPDDIVGSPATHGLPFLEVVDVPLDDEIDRLHGATWLRDGGSGRK